MKNSNNQFQIVLRINWSSKNKAFSGTLHIERACGMPASTQLLMKLYRRSAESCWLYWFQARYKRIWSMLLEEKKPASPTEYSPQRRAEREILSYLLLLYNIDKIIERITQKSWMKGRMLSSRDHCATHKFGRFLLKNSCFCFHL